MSYTLSMTINGIGTFAVESFSFGVENTTSTSSGTGSGSERVTVSPLTITKLLDANSARLFSNALTGKHLTKAALSLMMAGSTAPDAVYSLTEVVISSISHTGNGHGGVFPTEQISLVFGKIEFQIAGSVAGYDFATKPAG